MDAANELLVRTGKTITTLKKDIDESGKPASFVLDGKLKMQANVHLGVRRTRNVLGFAEGQDPCVRNQVIIVGAHYDHVGVMKDSIGIAYGADDNASGTAILLEIARAFAECKFKPRRSLLFIGFTGEERGLIGSQYYVDHPLMPLSKTIAFINLDMVGRNDPLAIKLASHGVPGAIDTIIQQSAKEVGIAIEPWDDGASSDQAAFLLKDVPSMWFFDGGGDFVHGPEDSWDRIVVEKLERVARLVFLGAYRIADRD